MLFPYSAALLVSCQDEARQAEKKSEIISEEVIEILNSSIAPNCYKGQYAKNSYKMGRQTAYQVGLWLYLIRLKCAVPFKVQLF